MKPFRQQDSSFMTANVLNVIFLAAADVITVQTFAGTLQEDGRHVGL